jgi:hypothetical protein
MQTRTGRREMIRTLASGSLIALPAGLFLVSCSSDDDDDATGAAPQKDGTKLVYTSSNVGGHTHTFGLEMSAIATPPAAGVSGSTSSDSAHTHEVSISSEQLQGVGAGESVQVTTSSVSGHTHMFTFVNVS